MRRIQGIPKLTSYLKAVNYPLTEKEIQDLIGNKKLPHKKLVNNIIIFDLDQIDWWINHNRTKEL
ncbi:hypothetical protein [Domibacillus robiginosus]|uniref:hypothetical protein n=1 Tax=Domibacillus robiginosus TaxID=1071054 RepID=UPI00067B514C|nr:hypothetical protein [Domibacillus robiginosus]